MVAHLSNAELTEASVPSEGANDDELLSFAASFHAYDVWGGLRPVQTVTYAVAEAWRGRRCLPRSLTVARTALFGEGRSERLATKADLATATPGGGSIAPT
jgi:hypothetical protein